MALKSIQLAAISPSSRAAGKFIVTVHADDGNKFADFDCDGERDAVELRNAIRVHAARLRHVADYSHATSGEQEQRPAAFELSQLELRTLILFHVREEARLLGESDSVDTKHGHAESINLYAEAMKHRDRAETFRAAIPHALGGTGF